MRADSATGHRGPSPRHTSYKLCLRGAERTVPPKPTLGDAKQQFVAKGGLCRPAPLLLRDLCHVLFILRGTSLSGEQESAHTHPAPPSPRPDTEVTRLRVDSTC